MPQEKLIDDVMAFICEHGIVAQGYVGFRREDAKQLIARIVEGPLPGEVARMPFRYNYTTLTQLSLLLTDEIIALRKEGTAKEEEE